MELITAFISHLQSQKKPASPITIKNYASDVKKFIAWASHNNNELLEPSVLSDRTFQEYEATLQTKFDPRSTMRHMSALRKFCSFLLEEKLIDSNPLAKEPKPNPEHDPLHLKAFELFLRSRQSSDLTIKNYIIDIKQFFLWFKTVLKNPSSYIVDAKPVDLLSSLDHQVVSVYKERLLHSAGLSPVSINRKLSSLRVFIRFAGEKGYMNSLSDQYITKNIKETPAEKTSVLPIYNMTSETKPELNRSTYSVFPPLRMIQKIASLGSLALDVAAVIPLAQTILYCQYGIWLLSGKKMFEEVIHQAKGSGKLTSKSLGQFSISNFSKEFYAPLSLSVKNLPWYKKAIHYLKHQRPEWYIRYHRMSAAHYAHVALLVVAVMFTGIFTYQYLFGLNPRGTSVLGDNNILSSRTLTFKGVLADKNNNPITNKTPVRFALYQEKESDTADNIWDEIQVVIPDQNGNFQVELGSQTPFTSDVFSRGSSLYLGVSVNNENELKPRQAIPNVALAENAKELRGMVPITSVGAGSKNVILALDSSGNLVIGRGSSPVFQATEGGLGLKGDILNFQTNSGSNGNIELNPDGAGIIDLQKPLQNTSEYSSIESALGAVTVDDLFAVLATSSGQSAFTVNQNGGGPLISASSSGIAKFTLQNTGDALFAGSLNLGGGEITSEQFSFNLFNRTVNILNFGGQAEALTIGSGSGTTTIRNATTVVRGNLTIAGTIGARLTGDGAGLTFTGNNNHTLKAESGKLILGSSLHLGKDISLIPESTEGTNNLGSKDNPFDTLYVNQIVSPSIPAGSTFWSLSNDTLSPTTISQNISVGSTSSPSWKIFAQGSNAGTTSSSGSLSFTGANPTINLLNGAHLNIKTSPGGDNLSVPILTATNNGNVGIGITNPLSRLHVVDTQAEKAVAHFENTSTNAEADVLRLKVANLNPANGNQFITFVKGDDSVLGSVVASSSGGVSYLTTNSDLAEYFRKANPDEVFATGDLVCLSDNGGVTRCDADRHSLLGVVTDRAGFVGNAKYQSDKSYLLVGLKGQIPLRVSDANGVIKPGDPLTYSDTPGVAVKAITSGQIVGQAISESKNGVLMSFTSPGWYDPTVSITNKGALSIVPEGIDPKTDTRHFAIVDTINNKVLSRFSVFSDAVIGNLEAGMIEAKDILVDGSINVAGTIVTSGVFTKKITTETAEITETLLAKIIRADSIESGTVTSPVANIDRVRVKVISPLADDSDLAIFIEKDKLALYNSIDSKVVTELDSKGNARFLGDLEAREASFSGTLNAKDASISGTITASRVKTDDLELSEEALSKLAGRLPQSTSSGQTINNITNIYKNDEEKEKQLALIAEELETSRRRRASQQAEKTKFEEAQSQAALSEIKAASVSGQFANSNEFHTDFATIHEGLVAFGSTSLADASVANQLSVGASLTITENSINVLGTTLSIQPLRQGDVSFMAGRVVIDTSGNLDVSGTATFAKDVIVKGTLTTNLIQPVPDSSLVIRLNRDKSQKQSLTVESSSGSAVLEVDTAGDLKASGSGSFLRLLTSNVNIVRQAQADTSTTETIATASAGTGVIKKGYLERTIKTPFVEEGSLIYITPTSDTFGMTPYIARQTAQNSDIDTEGSFTIQIPKPANKDVSVNWWIIN